MNNGKLATLKNWLKTLVLSPCSIARGDGIPPSTQTTASCATKLWDLGESQPVFFSPLSQLCHIAKLTMNHKNNLAKFGYRPDMKVIKNNNPCIFLLLAGTWL
jgi:hypothetical protein